MVDKILVPLSINYGRAIHGLGHIVDTPADFFKNPKSYKMVLFTGGEDVSPMLYNDTSPEGHCYYSTERDMFELKIAKVAMEYSIPMGGICRGLQFLNVVAGGKLMHHVSGHGGSNHKVVTIHGEEFNVNSLHHQMIIPPKESNLIGWAKENISKLYIGEKDKRIAYGGHENEIAIYPLIKGFGVQYHPEMMKEKTDGYQYFYNMAKSALSNWDKFVSTYGGSDIGKAQIRKHSGAVA